MDSGHQRRGHARNMVKAAGYARGGHVASVSQTMSDVPKAGGPWKYKKLDGGHDGYRSGGHVKVHAQHDHHHTVHHVHHVRGMAKGGLVTGKTDAEEHLGHTKAHKGSSLHQGPPLSQGFKRGGKVESDEAQDKRTVAKGVHKHERRMHKGEKPTPFADGGGIPVDGGGGGPGDKQPGGGGDHKEHHMQGTWHPPKMKEVAGKLYRRGGAVESDMGKPKNVHDLGYARGGAAKGGLKKLTSRGRHHKPSLPALGGAMATPPMPPVAETPPMPPDSTTGGASPPPSPAPMGAQGPGMKRGGRSR